MNFAVYIGQIDHATCLPCYATKDIDATAGTDIISVAELNSGSEIPYMVDTSNVQCDGKMTPTTPTTNQPLNPLVCHVRKPGSLPPLGKSWNKILMALMKL